MTTYYKDYSTLCNRARQVWGILIGYAHRRQTITHGKLARLMADGPSYQMPQRLSAVALWCKANGLPDLTSIVLQEDVGVPGEGIPIGSVSREQTRAYDTDWYGIEPPTANELEKAYTDHSKAA